MKIWLRWSKSSGSERAKIDRAIHAGWKPNMGLGPCAWLRRKNAATNRKRRAHE